MKKAILFIIIIVVSIYSVTLMPIAAQLEGKLDSTLLKEYQGRTAVVTADNAGSQILTYSLVYNTTNTTPTVVRVPNNYSLGRSKGDIVIVLEDIGLFSRVMFPEIPEMVEDGKVTIGFVQRRHLSFDAGLISSGNLCYFNEVAGYDYETNERKIISGRSMIHDRANGRLFVQPYDGDNPSYSFYWIEHDDARFDFDRTVLADIYSDTDGTVADEMPSPWAVEQVGEAISAYLISPSFLSGYTHATTRAEFCELAVGLYEMTNIGIIGRRAFSDTDDIYVQKAASIGVVSGIGDNKFAPDDLITREQAAVMLARLADAIGKPLPKSAATFSDNMGISTWAAEAVGQVQAAGIMHGAGNNTFAPNDPYTKEQSITTINRMYNLLLNTAAPVINETDITIPKSTYETRKWFDYYSDIHKASQMDKSGGIDIELTEYPGVTFRWTYERVIAIEAEGERDLIAGWPVRNVYFADLNGDGFPELCATVTIGSGIIDTRVLVYDYANGRQYDLSDRTMYDYVLSMENGQLVVFQRKYRDEAVIAVGRLVIVNGILTAIGIDRTSWR